MKFTASQLLLLAGSAIAGPVEAPHRMMRRQANAAGLDDATILNFALTLEHLEATFYQEALAKFPQAAFDAINASPRLRFNIQEIGRDEQNHVAFLTSALKAAGAKPVAACTYKFGLTDVNSFLATSSILEGVGVSAYLGAAAAIAEDAYLTAAGSILTVEARHNAYIRDNQMAPGPQSPFPTPNDVPLDPNQVYTLAAPFFDVCPPSNPPLPFKAFPSLTVADSSPDYLRAGMTITLQSAAKLTGTLYCAFPAIAGPYFSPAKISGKTASCKLPEGVPGESFVVLSKSNKAISDAQTVAGPAILQVQAPYTYPGFPGGYSN